MGLDVSFRVEGPFVRGTATVVMEMQPAGGGAYLTKTWTWDEWIEVMWGLFPSGAFLVSKPEEAEAVGVQYSNNPPSQYSHTYSVPRLDKTDSPTSMLGAMRDWERR